MSQVKLLPDTYLNQIKLELSQATREKAWQETATLTSETSRYRAYLNLLARENFINWLELILEKKITDNWQLKDNLNIWQFVNGSVIEIEESRIVLIPTETEDKSEIAVPQEWLTIPDWVGSYYVAVQVNIEESFISFWGYITYKELQSQGSLDMLNRTVDLEAEYLETDITLMIFDNEYGWETIPQVNPLSVLSTTEKEFFINQIKTTLSPRLLLYFDKWLGFISDKEILYSLANHGEIIHLTTWLTEKIEPIFTQGWQNLTDLIEQYLLTDFSLTPQWVTRSLTPIESLNILHNSQDETEINQAIFCLGNLSMNSEFKQQAIASLSDIITNTEDEEIRWNAALSLRLLAPNSEFSGYWRGKIVNLGLELANYDLALVMGILPKSETETSIFIRVYPLGDNNYLPANLHLQIIDAEGNIFKEIISRYEDNLIQYKLWANHGENIQVKLGLNDVWFTEKFCL